MRYTDTLYECRGCCGITARDVMSCPYCGKSEGPEYERRKLDGGTTTSTRAWYREVRIENHE